MKEIWKQIPDYKDYQISTFGRVKSLKYGKFRILKQGKAKGYLNISLLKNRKQRSFLVHQLVAMAFLNHKPCGHNLVVDHIDSNKRNNNVDNLRLITNRENCSIDKFGGTSKYVGVCWDKYAKKWKSSIQVKGVIKHLGYFIREIKAHEAYKRELTIKNHDNEKTK